MKVLLYLPMPGGLTGAPRRLLTLADSLRKQRFVVNAATVGGSDLFRASQQAGFNTTDITPLRILTLRDRALFGGGLLFRIRTFWALLWQNIRFCKVTRNLGADVVWVRGSKGIAFAGLGALLSRRPLVWDVDFELPSRGMVRWLHRFGLWASRAVVFQYETAPRGIFGKELADRYRNRCHALLPGISLNVIEPFRVNRLLREAGEKDPFVVLHVGTICDRKNQLFLVDVLARLRSARISKPVIIQLAGGIKDEAYVSQLWEAIIETGNEKSIEILGWRNDVHELMAQADLLVLPSRDEGVPNTVQEAMYIGLPVMVSNVGGMPEVVEHEKTGWVLPLDNSQAWSDQIVRCINDDECCRRVSLAASGYAESHFGTEAWGMQYAALLHEVAI